MNKYFQMMKSELKIGAQYSAWYWAGIISNILKITVLYYFWQAVYANTDEVGNIPLYTMLTYAIIANLLNNYMPGVGKEVGYLVRNGDIGIELIRPYDIFFKFLALDFGHKLTTFVQDTIPVLLVAFFFLGIETPQSIQTLFFFAISAFFGVLVGSQFDLIIGILAFWFKYIWGLMMLKTAVISFFAGALIPISLFPDWLATLSEFLPFKYMIYVPVAIYTNQITGTDIYFYLMMQLIWFSVIFFGIRLLWRLALKNVVIYGG